MRPQQEPISDLPVPSDQEIHDPLCFLPPANTAENQERDQHENIVQPSTEIRNDSQVDKIQQPQFSYRPQEQQQEQQQHPPSTYHQEGYLAARSSSNISETYHHTNGARYPPPQETAPVDHSLKPYHLYSPSVNSCFFYTSRDCITSSFN